MVFFSLEDYFFNITPLKRWSLLLIFIIAGSIVQYTRFINCYCEKKILAQKSLDQQVLINKLKTILAQKKILNDYCDFYKLSYDELKLLLAKIIDSNNYIKKIIIEPDHEKIDEKILVNIDSDN
jgi:hypothetical protein